MAAREGDSPTEPLADGATLEVRECQLRVVAGPSEGVAHRISGERVVVGTHASADLVLADPTLSRFHCEIALGDGKAVVRDLGSRNGTQVDGVPVLAAELRDGATLTLGRTQLRFSVGDTRVSIALSERSHFGRMVGSSVAARAAFARLERAAESDVVVLLQGETGTGKDVAAESIHRESARSGGPFVVVDCSAIPDGLLEAELFGHERGAFTGATAARAGAFESASGGTLFLDEIGELALDLQPKLLRAVERREVQPIGSGRRVPIDVRIIAASNRNLRVEVNEHRFRSDLYFRLAVLVVTLPPLRERAQDLPLLVERLLADLGAAEHHAAPMLRSDRVRAELRRHRWPGNVRELRNYVESCLALADPPPPEGSDDEAPAIDVTRPLRDVREQWLRHVERRYLQRILVEHGDNVSAAARAAGLDRVHFHRLLVRSGLR